MTDEITDVDGVPIIVHDVAQPVAVARTRSRDRRDHIMQYFAYSDMGASARALARPYHELAEKIHAEVADNPEREACLRSLLQSRDACLRAAKAQEPL